VSPEAMKWLAKFMGTAGVGNPSAKVKKELQALRPSQDLVLYRGKGWYEEELHRLDLEVTAYPFKKGEPFKFKYDRPSSWTTNKVVAEDFAERTGPCWIILKTGARPDQILVDTRQLAPDLQAELYKHSQQREVILLPGVYEAEVDTIGFKDDDSLTAGWPDKDPAVWKRIQQTSVESLSGWGLKPGTWRKHYNGKPGVSKGSEEKGAAFFVEFENNQWLATGHKWRRGGIEHREGRKFGTEQELLEYLRTGIHKDSTMRNTID
jgi:hypothetical protein